MLSDGALIRTTFSIASATVHLCCYFVMVLFCALKQVRQSGKSLPERIDLDGHGEIVRVGEPRALLEGRFRDQHERAAAAVPHVTSVTSGNLRMRSDSSSYAQMVDIEASRDPGMAMGLSAKAGAGDGKTQPTAPAEDRGIAPAASTTSLGAASPVNVAATNAGAGAANATTTVNPTYTENALLHQQCWFLPCGVEIRSYILNRHAELSATQLQQRSVSIKAPLVPYDPNADLVAKDLRDTPAVLNSIDKGMGACGWLSLFC
jgi:hypothetical protein